MDLLRSLPIGLYLEQPITPLHRLDARVKLGWLLTFLLGPIWASNAWRVAGVVLLILLTLGVGIPWRAWKQQMGWLLLITISVFVLTSVLSDGLAISSSPRLPAGPADLPQPNDYHYILWDLGRWKVTRNSFYMAIRFTTLLFTLVYSSSLYLLTTAPEEITAGLEELLSPLARFKIPITEILLTLTLSLRFIPLVLEEVQNLTRSIRTRAISWKKIGMKQSVNIWLVLAERLVENLLLRAEQIALAMDVRGFTSPDSHRVQWHQLQLRRWDGVAIALLVLVWGARLTWGWQV
ncbi:MAG: energy-coupling factor transporter transmembrane component T family protein [Spirulinaceae cyanobacterium]